MERFFFGPLPLLSGTLSSTPDMKAVINLEERIGKTVGRRTPPEDAFRYGMQLQKSGSQLLRTFGVRRFPKGVFRFHSHEEADAWMMKYLTQKDPI